MSVMLYGWDTIDVLSQNLVKDAFLTSKIVNSDSYKKRTEKQPDNFKEKPEHFIGRCLWYCWVANKTAYELQYRENITIPWSDEDTKFEDVEWDEQVSLCSSLQYNIFTNDGNYFLADIWVEGLKEIIEILEERNKIVNASSKEWKTLV